MTGGSVTVTPSIALAFCSVPKESSSAATMADVLMPSGGVTVASMMTDPSDRERLTSPAETPAMVPAIAALVALVFTSDTAARSVTKVIVG